MYITCPSKIAISEHDAIFNTLYNVLLGIEVDAQSIEMDIVEEGDNNENEEGEDDAPMRSFNPD